MTRLADSLSLAGCTLSNRLYRAPLLECAGNDEDTVDRLLSELEPAAAAGAGLIFQGATIVRGEGGCAAPGMTRVHDPAFLDSCAPLPAQIERHGSKLFIQLEHGGLRSMETWHASYRDQHPALRQLAVSRPPIAIRLLDRLGILALRPDVLSTDDVYELAADFGRAGQRAIAAGYHGIHLAGANMGIIQQFTSPYYNRRTDEFGGTGSGPRLGFLALLHDELRSRVGADVPIVTKVPAETAAPPFVRPRLSLEDGIAIARACERIGYDAVIPVTGTGFWDASIIRGKYPGRAWTDPQFREEYRTVFGGPIRYRLVKLGNWLQARQFDREPGWNAEFCERVRREVTIPVGIEGGIRSRTQIDQLLGSVADFVGMGRPFYAEPRLPARLLHEAGASVVCESCNNCTVPQVTGAPGICRTPSVLARHGELVKAGAYEEPTQE